MADPAVSDADVFDILANFNPVTDTILDDTSGVFDTELSMTDFLDFAEAAFFAVAVLALAFFTTPVFFAAVDLLAGALAAGLGFAGALADLESGLFC